MPRITAQLLNARGRVTTHECIRLEIRRKPRPAVLVGRMSGIYAIYRCTETDDERIFGCLQLGTHLDDVRRLYPGIPMVNADEFEQPEADDDLAA